MAAGPHLLLVVADADPAKAVAVPASFPDLAAVRAFAGRPDVALRRVLAT